MGRGAFGQVYLGLDTRTGEHVAIKQLSLERLPAESLQVRPGTPGCQATAGWLLECYILLDWCVCATAASAVLRLPHPTASQAHSRGTYLLPCSACRAS